ELDRTADRIPGGVELLRVNLAAVGVARIGHHEAAIGQGNDAAEGAIRDGDSGLRLDAGRVEEVDGHAAPARPGHREATARQRRESGYAGAAKGVELEHRAAVTLRIIDACGRVDRSPDGDEAAARETHDAEEIAVVRRCDRQRRADRGTIRVVALRDD